MNGIHQIVDESTVEKCQMPTIKLPLLLEMEKRDVIEKKGCFLLGRIRGCSKHSFIHILRVIQRRELRALKPMCISFYNVPRVCCAQLQRIVRNVLRTFQSEKFRAEKAVIELHDTHTAAQTCATEHITHFAFSTVLNKPAIFSTNFFIQIIFHTNVSNS